MANIRLWESISPPYHEVLILRLSGQLELHRRHCIPIHSGVPFLYNNALCELATYAQTEWSLATDLGRHPVPLLEGPRNKLFLHPYLHFYEALVGFPYG
jgi:hypothetical protein